MADMKQQFKDAAVDIFQSFASVAERVTYNQIKGGSFDAATGKFPTTTKKNTVQAIFLNIHKEQQAIVELVKGDMLVLLPGKNIKFVPQLQDQIVRGTETYTVKGIDVDPAGAVIKLQVSL